MNCRVPMLYLTMKQNQLKMLQILVVYLYAAFFCQSMGQMELYRVGEVCLACNSAGEQAVVKISNIFAINLSNTYFSFVEGRRYAPDTANPVTHQYSGNPIVTEAPNHLMCSASQIEKGDAISTPNTS